MIRTRFVPSAGEDQERPAYSRGFPRLAGQDDWYGTPQQRVWRPPTDVYETDEHVVIKVEVAGMAEEDFEISFVDRRLIIAGQRRDPAGKLIYQNMEIRYGAFRSEIRVEWAVEQTAIEASYVGGFLFVRLPKAMEYRIPIRTVNGEQT